MPPATHEYATSPATITTASLAERAGQAWNVIAPGVGLICGHRRTSQLQDKPLTSEIIQIGAVSSWSP